MFPAFRGNDDATRRNVFPPDTEHNRTLREKTDRLFIAVENIADEKNERSHGNIVGSKKDKYLRSATSAIS